MQSIKNIIFDMGGVFLNIDYKRTERAFIEAKLIRSIFTGLSAGQRKWK